MVHPRHYHHYHQRCTPTASSYLARLIHENGDGGPCSVSTCLLSVSCVLLGCCGYAGDLVSVEEEDSRILPPSSSSSGMQILHSMP